mgnify:CR=1
MWYGQRRSCRSRGFSLTEMLVGITLMLMITFPLLPALKASADKTVSYSEDTRAHVRISRAKAILKSPVFYCGLGMPASPSDYKRSFGNQKFDPFRWEGPISVYKGPSGLENSELRISYSRKGSTKVLYAVESDTDEARFRLHKFPEVNEIGESFSKNSSDIRNWVFFPSSLPSATPFCVTGLSGNEITVRNSTNAPFCICGGDRMHHMRAMKVYALNDCLYTKDFRSAGDQPRVTGIMDIRFDVDLPNRTVAVYILARGDKLYDSPQEISGKEDWPEEYIGYWIGKGSRYRLFAAKFIWYLPNLRASELYLE